MYMDLTALHTWCSGTCFNDWLYYGANWGAILWYNGTIIYEKYEYLSRQPGANITEIAIECSDEEDALIENHVL